jgi:hypothetical protein
VDLHLAGVWLVAMREGVSADELEVGPEIAVHVRKELRTLSGDVA